MPVTPESATTALAYFKPLAGEGANTSVEVHFNPESLQYTVTNTQDPKRKSGAGVQFVTQSTAKLTMDLVFDTTLTGVDVRVGSDQRIGTDKMAKLLRPYQDGGGKVPPSVEFGWGLYKFTGIVEQYKETLDFFSADGVPLRSSVNITLSSNTIVFDSARNPTASVDGSITPEPVVLPGSAGPSPPVVGGAGAAGASSVAGTSSVASPSSVANTLSDPRAARGIASLSGSESLRFAGGRAAIVVAGSVNLSPPAAFSAGGGLRIGGAVGVGAGLGIAATAGPAFVGLHVGAHVSTSRGVTNPQALLPSPRVGSGGGFALGGAAHTSAGGSLSADVGASANLSARIQFPD